MMYRRAAQLFFVCLFVFASLPHTATAQSLFTVDNVRVDVTADNALQARDQAFEQAQVKAFKQLANTLKQNGDIDTFTMPKPSVISTLVQDYEITNEKLSAVRYIGTYTFRFRENASRRFLMPAAAPAPVTVATNTHNNTPYTPYAAPSAVSGPLLILPFIENTDGKISLWTPENTWLKAWNSARALNGAVNVRVPIGDLQDVGDINDDNALNFDPAGLNRLMARYTVNGAVIAVAAQSGNAMHVDIYRPQTPRPVFIKRININTPNNDAAYGVGATNMAVMQTFNYIQANASSFIHTPSHLQTAAQNNRPQTLHVRVPFLNPREWAETQNVLRGVNAVKAIQVKSLSPKSAYIDIVYQGARPDLLAALARANVTVNAPKAGQSGMTEIRLSRYSGNSYIQRF